MMSVSQIVDMSREAGLRAARDGRRPFVVEAQDRSSDVARHLPSLGSHRPVGWRLLGHFQVNKHGVGDGFSFGIDDMPLVAGRGYALIEEGPFQVVIGEFERR